MSGARIQIKLFTSSIPTLKPLLHKKCNVALPRPQLSSLQHCQCAARILILCCWALQGYSAIGHCRDTFRVGRAVYLVVGHCRDTLQLGTAGILCGWAMRGYLVVERWALQGYSAVGHCRETWWLSTAGILCGWALQGDLVVGQGYLVVEHCRDTLRFGTAGRLGTAGLVTKVGFQ